MLGCGLSIQSGVIWVKEKPFSQACENNKDPILRVLRSAFAGTKRVLEVGSGTGQHAVYFAQHLSHLLWQPSDRAENLPGIQLWLEAYKLTNMLPLLELDVTMANWPITQVDALFSANTLHIMGTSEVALFFEKVDQVLLSGGKLCVYGPFNYQGQFTSESNARFNQWLYQQNPKSAIRDFEWIDGLAGKIGLTLLQDHAMPANNRLLEWQRC